MGSKNFLVDMARPRTRCGPRNKGMPETISDRTAAILAGSVILLIILAGCITGPV